MENFDERTIEEYQNKFKNIPENIVICINESITQSKILPIIKDISCYTIDCTNDWKSKQKKIIINTNKCIESCNNSSRFQYE